MATGNTPGSGTKTKLEQTGTQFTEDDVAKMIEFLSLQGKYKVLTTDEYDLMAHRHPDKKEFGHLPDATSTPKVSEYKIPPRPPPPVPTRKYHHDFSDVNNSKPKVSFNKGNFTHDMSGNTPTYQRPRLPVFSGEAKGETSFDVWKFEVKCLLREQLYPELIIVQCMRNALKGQARNTLLTLPETATPVQIIEKLEGIYGNVYSNETLLQTFYTQKQEDGQSVAEYGMKLENILQKAFEKGKLSQEVRSDMLRTRFWSGLRDPALKNATRYKYDTIKNFDELRKEVRAIELELELSSTPKSSSATHQPVTAFSDMSEMNKTLQSMNKKLEEFAGELKKLKEEKKTEDFSHKNFQQGSGFGNRGYQRGRFNNYYRRNGRGRGFRGNNRGQGDRNNSDNNKSAGKTQSQNQDLNSD